MASAYCGTIFELKQLYQSGQLETLFSENYRNHFGNPSPSLIRSWVNSIPELLKALPSPEFDNILVLVELRMPIGDEKADVILLGGTPSNRKGVVIELKQWSSVASTNSNLFISVPGLGREKHPSAQALNYEGKLKMLHSEGEHYSWKSVCLLHNLDSDYREILEPGINAGILERSPIFYKGSENHLGDYLCEHLLPAGLTLAEASQFENAPYKQTQSFFNIIQENAVEIADSVTEAIADTGAGLTSEQEALVEDILISATARENRVFIVQGSPGSGKSLVAIHLLLKALSKGQQTLLALRNNRLMTILRQCLNQAYPGASGTTIYSSVPRTGRGLGDVGYSWNGDLVVCDESQRFNEQNLPIIMERAPTTVFFYDESQILNPPEQGNKQNFRKYATQVGKELVELRLSAFLRCRGGEAYHSWVDTLITNSNIPSEDNTLLWQESYEVEIFDNINDMIDKLRSKTSDHKVALLASFTESRGNMNASFHKDNIRIGYPLASGLDLYKDSGLNIPWLMNPQKDYTPFWIGGKSNDLNSISSIYGCQGFESDFAGLVWGRDFVRRGDRWGVGDSRVITDNIDGLRSATISDPELAFKLLQNRYRIFLTRGMLGTFVFCEDEETREFLRDRMHDLA